MFILQSTYTEYDTNIIDDEYFNKANTLVFENLVGYRYLIDKIQ
jgi:hypothetical protein